MALWNRFEMGFPQGPVAAIGGAIGGAASAAGPAIGALGELGGMFGGGGGSAGASSAGATYQQQVEMAMLANAERQNIADDYFTSLIGKKEIQKGPRKGETVYGNINDLLMGQTRQDVFGKKPKYYPIDFQTALEQDRGFANVAADVTEGNLKNFQANAQLAQGVNNFLTADAKGRVGAFDPYLLGNLEQTGRNAQLAGAGILPTSDAESIVGNRNEMAGIFGTAGTSRGQVAKDLGLARLDLQTKVAPMLNQTNAAIINAIAPPQMRDDPRSREVQNSQAIQIGAADNQFEAQFDRQEQNLRSLLNSIPDPAAQGIFNLQNTLRAQQFVIDFGLANGLGVPGTMPDNLGEEGMMGFTQGMQGAGSFMSNIGSIFGGSSMSSPGIFG
jgi:hypothetical protein